MHTLFRTSDQQGLQGPLGEAFDLIKAWAGVTLAFAIVQTGPSDMLTAAFPPNLLISGIVCGLGFVLHELAHRVVARAYGAQAHFIANNSMLLVSLLLAFVGIFFIAPGGVWPRGPLTVRQVGHMALAGPVTNMILAVMFLFALIGILIAWIEAPVWVFNLCLIGFKLNSWLGLFNMLPAGPLDGAKVLNWSVPAFAVAIGVGVVLALVLGNDDTLRSVLTFILK